MRTRPHPVLQFLAWMLLGPFVAAGAALYFAFYAGYLALYYCVYLPAIWLRGRRKVQA